MKGDILDLSGAMCIRVQSFVEPAAQPAEQFLLEAVALKAADVDMIGRKGDRVAVSADLLHNEEYSQRMHLLQVLHLMNESRVEVRGANDYTIEPEALLHNIDQRIKLLEMQYLTTVHLCKKE